MSLVITGSNTVRNLPEAGTAAFRQLKTGEMGVGHVHPRYYESTRRLGRFYAANQTAVTTTVSLTTTYTGLVVINPAASPVDLVIDKASWAFSVAPAAIATVGLFTGFATAGLTAFTALTSVANCYAGGPAGFGKAAAAGITLVGTPQYVAQFVQGFTAAALGTSGSLIDVEGAIVVPPGGYCGIGALTVSVGLGSIMWEEVLRQPS